jgi:hypothetical protein
VFAIPAGMRGVVPTAVFTLAKLCSPSGYREEDKGEQF